jgi:hypothetical protein
MLAAAAAALVAAAAHAGCPPTITLAGYHLVGAYPLAPNLMTEASAVTWNWDTDTLFVVPDACTGIFEVSKTGQLKSAMYMVGFQDLEGVCYLGNGTFAVVEERLGRAYRFTYQPGVLLSRTGLQNIAVGPNTGTNSGSEGMSYDPRDGSWVSIKEKSPQNVFRVTGSFANGASTYVDLFSPASLAVADIADCLCLSTVPTLAASPERDNLLILSQESNRLLKVNRAGQVLGSMDLSGLNDNPEGVAMDASRTIYLCSDSTTPMLYVYAPPASDACTCPTDLNGDHATDGADIGYLLAMWGTASAGEPADVNGDGRVDGADLGLLLAAWGACP